jgi:16S rRNA (cytidine1402-2'-O)-methyltransferase
MGTLYVVGVPGGDPDDITLRALRALREVALVVAEDEGLALYLLTHYGIDTPFATTSDEDVLLAALEAGDAALLTGGWSPGLSGSATELLWVVLERGFPVVPVPGPDLLTGALVASGLPADNLILLGELPEHSTVRRRLLMSVVSERRTLIMIESGYRLAATLTDLHDIVGNRNLALAATAEASPAPIWRGTVDEGLVYWREHPTHDPVALIVGGVREQIRWDEAQLCAQIRDLLDRGLGVKELSQRLSAEAGWSRREIYRLAVEIARHLHEP